MLGNRGQLRVMTTYRHYIYARVDADTFLVSTSLLAVNAGTEGEERTRDKVADLIKNEPPVVTAYLDSDLGPFVTKGARVNVHVGANGKKWLRTDSNKTEEDNLGELLTVEKLKDHRLKVVVRSGLP